MLMPMSLEELWKYACGVAQQEMKDTEPLHFEPIAPDAVKQAIEKIDQALKDKGQAISLK